MTRERTEAEWKEEFKEMSSFHQAFLFGFLAGRLKERGALDVETLAPTEPVPEDIVDAAWCLRTRVQSGAVE